MRRKDRNTNPAPFPRGSKCLLKITPFERSNGVLIPGHRFEPFRPLETDLWRIELAVGGTKIAAKKIAVPLREIG